MQDLSPAELVPAPVPLPPVRGLVPLHNAAGKAFALSDCHRALRYQCHAFDVLKLDLLADHLPGLGVMESCLAYAREFQVRVSLRTNGIYPPGLLAPWSEQGLFDVCLAGSWTAPPQAWLEACKAHNLPVRIMMPLRAATPDLVALSAWAQAGVRSVTFFRASADEATAAAKDAWKEALRQQQIGCVTFACGNPGEVLLSLEAPEPAFFSDHQQYDRAAYDFARRCFAMSRRGLHSQLIFEALQLGGIETPSDQKLVQFLREHTRLYAPVHAAARAARHLVGKAPEAPAPHVTAPVVYDATARYFDSVDMERLKSAEVLSALAREAADWQREQAPSTVFDSGSWGFVNAYFEPMPGVNRLHAIIPGEKCSTKLPYLRPPFMVSATIGGGIADYIGFAIGRHIRIACPMTATSHQLTLYADQAGRYVLLRDGQPVAPARIEGRGYTPPRLPDGVHLQLAVWNPEPQLSVTEVRAWQRPTAVAVDSAPPAYAVSIVVFSTRFSRRLQAALQALAHQQGVALETVQCIVGLVPGLDGAEDVVDTLRQAYPQWHVETVALPVQYANSKGFALNECLQRVSSPLVVLLDSDIVAPPNFLAQAIDASEEHGFIAPAGRAMLDAPTTARILLGEVKPWEEFESLMASAPEMRVEENPEQVPLGYCQVFKASALESLHHAEYGHFGAADYEFGAALKEHFGGVRRLAEPVLHLHHDARQWFGARKHF